MLQIRPHLWHINDPSSKGNYIRAIIRLIHDCELWLFSNSIQTRLIYKSYLYICYALINIWLHVKCHYSTTNYAGLRISDGIITMICHAKSCFSSSGWPCRSNNIFILRIVDIVRRRSSISQVNCVASRWSLPITAML